MDFIRPIHTVALVALGLWLIDNVDLTELAQACLKEENRWDFFFAALPWRMKGVTSSASNPVAVFSRGCPTVGRQRRRNHRPGSGPGSADDCEIPRRS